MLAPLLGLSPVIVCAAAHAVIASAALGALLGPRHRQAPGAADAKIEAAIDRIFEAALPDGRWHAGLMRGKLRHDPVSRVALGALDGARLLLDVGGGVGSLALAACAIGDLDKAAVLDWDEPKLVRGRRIATRLAMPVEYHHQDVFDSRLPRPGADVVLCIDVLHYADLAAQRWLVGELAASLPPGGRLLIRDMDADLKLRTACTVVQERLALMVGHTRAEKIVPRSGSDLAAQLRGAGLSVYTLRCHGWLPFSNMLWIAVRPA